MISQTRPYILHSELNQPKYVVHKSTRSDNVPGVAVALGLQMVNVLTVYICPSQPSLRITGVPLQLFGALAGARVVVDLVRWHLHLAYTSPYI